MRKIKIVVGIVTLYLILFQVSPYIGIAEDVIFLLFFFFPFLFVYMIYIVLNNGTASGHTFEERFYDDWDYIRNGREEPDVKE